MMLKTLNSPLEEYTHILHVADIHIRLNTRHEEYRQVFDRLYERVANTPQKTVVAVLGDVFHSKSELTPEAVQLASEFFSKLSAIRPTVVVLGNHDLTLSNKNRLDSISPIIEALNNPNLFYLKDTGLYGFGNILWNNMSISDDPQNYIRGEDIPKIYRNKFHHIVALFHGPVDGASSDTGYSISNPSVVPSLFDWNDIALLGDIHIKQDIQLYCEEKHKPCIHYPGSLIQQNHSEDLKNHGYSLWDLSKRTYEFTRIENDYGFFTVDIIKGVLLTEIKSLPSKTRLRVRSVDTNETEIKQIVANISKNVKECETSFEQIINSDSGLLSNSSIIKIADISKSDYQCNLISDYLKNTLGVTDQNIIDKVLEINKIVSSKIKKDEFSRNLKWIPIKFEWDNMFTFGEGNVINFENMNGVYGIFGPNRIGKSSVLSALCFCLFDKFDRGFKGIHVKNTKKSSFRCKFEFEISKVRYFIERVGESTKSGAVKVNVRFWKLVDGVEEELHGTDRRDTNDVIREYVGTFEDFMLTSLTVQSTKNNMNFIDMGHTDRKDLLVQFMGLNVFDQLNDLASERSKELNSLLKFHKDKNYSIDLTNYNNSLSQYQSQYRECKNKIESINIDIEKINSNIVEETAKIIKLNDGVPNNVVPLENRKKEINNSLFENTSKISSENEALFKLENLIKDLEPEIYDIEKSNLKESYATFKSLKQLISEVNHKIEMKKLEVSSKMEKLNKLKNHKFDPNCKFCCDNIFVKDAEKTRTELGKDKEEAEKMVLDLTELKEKFKTVEDVENKYDRYLTLLNKRNKFKDDYDKCNKTIGYINSRSESLNKELETVSNQIDLYYRNQNEVKNNEKIESNIYLLRTKLKTLKESLNKSYETFNNVDSNIKLLKDKIQSTSEMLNNIKQMEDEFQCYQMYLKSVGRDGIPYQVISTVVPQIEKEVNSILNQLDKFKLEFETDGKNVIPYIVQGDHKWPIELASGFERFAASIAIRVSLTKLSNLPKTTFLCIDEGFGVLDGEHRAEMANLFSYLKSNFDFILIVTHLVDMKDAVDKRIEISTDGTEFSKLISN